MKILLISPGTAEEIDNKIIREIPYLGVKAYFAPHAVAAVAALTSNEHEVVIHDEYIRGNVELILEENIYDIIGISITSNQLNRSLQIADFCKKNSPKSTLVVGGIGVEMLVHKHMDKIDVVFHGEVEDTWPRFLEDFKTGNFHPIYKNVSKPDMTKVPAPRWELIKDDIRFYNSVSIQTTRGCPFDCNFCDVIYTYGRKARSKTIYQVLEELKKLNQLKVQTVFFADDNFSGDVKYTKELLKKLIELNNSFEKPIAFYTQLDITIANDDELLKLLADCNFYTLMIGVESVNVESLKEMNKKQNIGISAVDAIKKIQSYGMVVLTHMIIGADSDDLTSFQKTASFVKEANVVFHICHPLAAPPGTKFWYDLKRQNRIIATEQVDASDKMDIITNIIPKNMTRIQLFDGLATYWEEVYKTDRFIQQALGYLNEIKYMPKFKKAGMKDLWKMRKLLKGVFKYYFFTAEKIHRKGFLTLIKSVKNKGIMVPKITYLYTFHLIDYKRSLYDAAVAREHAKWEKENPDKIIIDSKIIPVSEKIREQSLQICEAIYRKVSEITLEKEIVYQTVLNTLHDFNDRFGNTFEVFDAYHNEQIINICDRVLAQLKKSGNETKYLLPLSPPPGFTREIMDALDNTVRYKTMYN
jgi:radical SAM superfamily enzyme YgiQ (UPF0313 family)